MRKMMMSMCSACLMAAAHADEKTVEMRTVNANDLSESIATVTVLTMPWGVLFTSDLSDLPPGLHGFHVHQNANCAPAKDEGEMAAAMVAGRHYDPQSTGRHEGSYGDGHLGDLPGLYVDAEGNAKHPVLASRLKLSDLNGPALMIHAGGNVYSDKPVELGAADRASFAALSSRSGTAWLGHI